MNKAHLMNFWVRLLEKGEVRRTSPKGRFAERLCHQYFNSMLSYCSFGWTTTPFFERRW